MGPWRRATLLTTRLLLENEASAPQVAAMRNVLRSIATGADPKNGLQPGFFFLQPKDHLVERYYSPENMSSAERHQLSLTKVREEFRVHDSDCGSCQVQVALLTERIKFLSQHMQTHKKDVHSRKGLEALVQKRRSLLKYFRRKDWDAYCQLISRLGLRDKTATESR